MARLVFDIETNGFLDAVTTLHSIVYHDLDTGEVVSACHAADSHPKKYTSIQDALQALMNADEMIGHNICKYDLAVLRKLYPWFKPKGRILDTLHMARLFIPEIKQADAKLIKRKLLPGHMLGRYSLEAFGYRMGKWKGDYSKVMKERGLDPWASWNPEMQDYCEQDVDVNVALYERLLKKWHDLEQPDPAKRIPHSDRSVDLEMKVAAIVARQEAWGFAFDLAKAAKLYAVLVGERDRLDLKLRETFGSWLCSDGVMIPKKDRNVKRKDLPPLGFKTKRNGDQEPIYVTEGYSTDAAYTRVKTVEFNPGSRHHIANRLQTIHGWRPHEYGKDGVPTVDETVLSAMEWPEAPLLIEYLTVVKRLGQLADGKEAWLKHEKNGRIHGGVITLGAVTRRMTHSKPNVAQVPKCGTPYGTECRELFTSTAGFVLVGCDADSLELRCLAGYMARYDNGAYIETVLKGDKSNGTDMHSVNARAIGLDPKKLYPVDGKEIPGREIAKTWFYAFIYGAGDFKLGLILGVKGDQKKVTDAGMKSKRSFMKNLPALGQLVNAVKERAQSQGFLKSLDGGRLRVRKAHASLNTLLQSAGAIIMKVALVILDEDLQAAGLVPGKDYEFAANIHDELQIDVRPEHVSLVKDMSEQSIRKAGEALEFRCPLAGNADTGSTWAETH